jgi:hypothetical protein
LYGILLVESIHKDSMKTLKCYFYNSWFSEGLLWGGGSVTRNTNNNYIFINFRLSVYYLHFHITLLFELYLNRVHSKVYTLKTNKLLDHNKVHKQFFMFVSPGHVLMHFCHSILKQRRFSIFNFFCLS